MEHLHCNITRLSHNLYTTSLPGTSVPLTLELSLVVRYKKVSFHPHWKCPCGILGFTFSCHFSAESTSAAASPLLTDFRVMLHLSLKCCNHPLEHLKLMPIFMPISLAFDFTVCPPTASLFFQAWQNYSNIPSSILSWFVPRMLCHCEACCFVESQYFKYVDRLESGFP